MSTGLSESPTLEVEKDSGLPKVCVLAYHIAPHYDGAGMIATRCAAYLARHSEPVELLTCIPNPDPVEAVEIVQFKMPSWYALRGGGGGFAAVKRYMYGAVIVRRLRALFIERRVDVVHCVAAKWFSLLGVQAARMAGIPSIIQTSLLGKDDAEAVSGEKFGWIKLALFKKADCVVNASPSLEEACIRGGIPRERCELIVNPVDVERFAPISEAEKLRLRSRLGIDHFDQVLLTVGIVRPRKNTAEMVSLLASIADVVPRACLVVVGPHDKDDESRAYAVQVREQISEAGLETRVVLTGMVENVHEWMQAADLFLFASESEGLPNVMLEALSTGLPVVSTPIHGIASFVIDEGANGFVVPEMQHSWQLVSRLLADSELRAKLSKAARDVALQRFSEEVVMERYRALYRRLVH